MRRTVWAGLALALVFCLALPAAWAKDPAWPALTGRVVDDAGILSESTEANLTGWLEGFERDTKRQVVVATVKSLQDLPIEDYANALFRAWGLGEKSKNTGALLVVAPNDRAVRIEVGYGLEGELTDALSSAIIQQQIIPSFRQGDYETGVTNGTAAILRTLGWTGAPMPQPAAQPIDGPGPGGFDWSALIYFGFIAIIVIFRALFGMGRRRRPGFWGTSSSGWGGGGWSGGGGGWSSGGGFSGGGGSSGGGGASGRW